MSENLWPEFEPAPKLRSPKDILVEQGVFLSKKTQHMLLGEVKGASTGSEQFLWYFYIIAPNLNNYRYELLYIIHDMFFYPLRLSFDGTSSTVENEEQFLQHLKQVFNNSKTLKIVSNLMSQSLSKG